MSTTTARTASNSGLIPDALGYRRSDGRVGIRDNVLVAYLVECAHHVCREIVAPFQEDGNVQVVGFPGCYPNAYAEQIMTRLCLHPNTGAVVLVSLGCESFDRVALADRIRESGRPVRTLVIQETGGTRATVEAGRATVRDALDVLKDTPRTPVAWSDLTVGTICGGSDGTSGLTANPAVGRAFDRLTARGARCVFEETGELIGCEHHMEQRAVTPELGAEIVRTVRKAADYYEVLGHASIAPGNVEGGLTTIEEKSMGAYAKSGASEIRGIIRPGELPPTGGLYLLDVVPDGEPRHGYPNMNDTVEIVELIASGAQVVLFTTGRGSVVGSAVSPVVKVCANPDTYRRMSEDMDIDAGRILAGEASLDEVGDEIVEAIARTVRGEPTKSEALGHQEFQLGYKSFKPSGPACLPV
ncbi:UxaA family hydrolase [Streptomyces sp. A475]|uniref:UxaA family hydrolase n=1 Tax=Streptomyces sp. A475 TaxID=3131976 RepID=UPI0030CA062F